jgi:alpha-glucuronidase
MNSTSAHSVFQPSRVPPVSLLRPGYPRPSIRTFVLASVLTVSASASAQTADQAWLKYEKSTPREIGSVCVRTLGNSPLEQTAVQELARSHMGFEDPSTSNAPLVCGSDAAPGFKNDPGDVVLGTATEVQKSFPDLKVPAVLGPGAYWLTHALVHGRAWVIAIGGDDQGVLYGALALLRRLRQGQLIYPVDIHESPAFPIRWVDEWDNPDGSIERGYAGCSIFFENGNVRHDLAPVAEYGRLLASVGINGLNVNNVNAAPQLIDSDHLKQIARIADALRPWGVHLAMSVAIASPQTIGGLPTYDPLDPAVKAWWAAKANEIYTLIPDFAGFTVKADSEGQPGPASFGRTPADAANTLAAALAPHGGVVLYRAFVYNHHLDWRDPKADRARAAYDIFHPLDGKFARNVIIQIKEGPIDFQVREPVSPLFAGLRQTSQAMEVQITQEYTGQQRHLVYLAPMWKQVLDTDLRANHQSNPVKNILAGRSLRRTLTQPDAFAPVPAGTLSGSVTGHDFSRAANRPKLDGALASAEMPLGGMVAVAGIGRDRWLGSPLALANLYAFGRLAWNSDLDPAEIAAEWTRQTIATDPEVVRTVTAMLMQSWPAYEAYTGPLGLQTLTDITGSHYGPNIESSERNGWGQWHDADAQGVGKDRSVATGSGYAGQYPPEVAKLYESAATTPDDLLLFFHHVPYTYRLHSGKTVIQYLYDSHYDGAAQAAHFVDEWEALKGRIDPALYEDVRARLEYQAGHAIVWRDAIAQYFLKLSGIPDEKGRAGHYPGRLEAEYARLSGYKIIEVTPWEDASFGKAVACPSTTSSSTEKPNTEGGGGFNPRREPQNLTGALAPDRSNPCIAEWTFNGMPGRYNIAVQYFDLQSGTASFTLSVNSQPRANWQADANLPSKHPNGDNSTRHIIRSIDLKPGDTIRVEGTPDGSDPAALDYIEITPAP